MSINQSLSNNIWKQRHIDKNLAEQLVQSKSISEIFSKLLTIRGISINNYDNFINPDILTNLPNPFKLKDMKKGIDRCIVAIKNNEKIGIVADYDVDGSTSASILYKFLFNFTSNIIIKIPDRLNEGYGPNKRIMNEMLKENVSLLFTLDCGTSSFRIIDDIKYKNISVIVLDHHLSEHTLPNVHSIINPNRYDEENDYKDLAAVGVTFLFLMALRKEIRNLNLFKNIKEPNLLSFLDLVALGTICDIVNIKTYNRVLVKKGLDLIVQRRNKNISIIIDNSKINSTPTATDLGFIVGPQINAASRLDDSSLASKLLITNNQLELETISKKLFLINEKRKLVENKILIDAKKQAEKQKSNNFILIYDQNWHHGVLGIVASRIVTLYNKPTFIISFQNKLGTGSGRSINNIDIGSIILELKNLSIIEQGGGHKMAVGFKINYDNINNLNKFLKNKFSYYERNLFKKIIFYDLEISINQVNSELIEMIEKIEPIGKGNHEPQFLIKDIIIENIKIIKEKHILVFFNNDFDKKMRAICFNCIQTETGEYLENFKKFKFNFICSVKKNNYSNDSSPQIIINDLKVIK